MEMRIPSPDFPAAVDGSPRREPALTLVIVIDYSEQYEAVLGKEVL